MTMRDRLIGVLDARLGPHKETQQTVDELLAAMRVPTLAMVDAGMAVGRENADYALYAHSSDAAVLPWQAMIDSANA